MRGLKVVGLDLSLTATGIATVEAEAPERALCRIRTEVVKWPALVRGHERLGGIIGRVRTACLGADLVVMEGPAFGAKGDAYHQLAGLWWLIKHDVLEGDLRPYTVVSPATLKQYMTGSGNAAKAAVMRDAARRWPDVDLADDNAADALGLAAMGCRALDVPIDDMPAKQRAAMTKVTWPALLPS